MYQVVKRDGKITEFQIGKISDAITKAFDALGQHQTTRKLKTLFILLPICECLNKPRQLHYKLIISCVDNDSLGWWRTQLLVVFTDFLCLQAKHLWG